MHNRPYTIVGSIILTLTLLFGSLVSCNQGKSETDTNANKKEWVDLFNGQNLDGWDLKIRGYALNDNYNNTFRVENGLMKVRYDQYDEYQNKFGHIFYNRPFSYYHLKVEYRFVGEQVNGGEGWALRNNGIMFHSQSAESMGLDQDFPISIEYQLLGGNGEDERTTANLCTPGTNVVIGDSLVTQHCISSSSKTYHGDQWVTAEVLVLGDSLVQHIIDDEVVLQYTKPQIGGGTVSGFDPAIKQDGKLLNEGYIAFQSESHPIDIRSVKLLELQGCMDQTATNYKSYYVKHNESSCTYK